MGSRPKWRLILTLQILWLGYAVPLLAVTAEGLSTSQLGGSPAEPTRVKLVLSVRISNPHHVLVAYTLVSRERIVFSGLDIW
jgi:hypothetical protein